MSVAVRVALPAVFRVTLKVRVPPASEELGGRLALLSLEVMPTVWVTFVIRFQFASTALTVRVKAVPEAAGDGCPTLPVAVPGTAVSPGTSNCSLVNGPGLTVMEGLVEEALVLSVTSLAVTVALPLVLRVTLKV